MKTVFIVISDFIPISAMHPTRYDMEVASRMGTCFREVPYPSVPLSGGDEDLYSPASCRTNIFSANDESPCFDKIELHDMDKTINDSRFIAQHVKNKDAFENVSILGGLHIKKKLFDYIFFFSNDLLNMAFKI